MTSENQAEPSVFLVTNVPFWQEVRGSSERLRTMLKYLGSFCKLKVCFVGQMSIADWNQAKGCLDCELVGPGMPGRLASAVVQAMTKIKSRSSKEKAIESNPLSNKSPVTLENFQSDIIAEYVAAQVQLDQPDVVILEYVIMAYLCDVLRKPNGPLLMLDTHDLMHVRSEELRSLGQDNWLAITKDEEVAALQKTDVIMAIQESEAELLGELLPGHEVCVVKHSVESKQGPNSHEDKVNFSIGFVGSVGLSNKQSIETFLSHCWPSIRSQSDSGVTLRIGGGLSANDLKPELDLAGVEFIGRFDHPGDFYRQLNIAINPAVVSSGLKVKSLDAIAHSVPLVTTRAGIAGLENSNGKCAVLAQNWDEFTSTILNLINDPAWVASLASNCRPFVDADFSPANVYGDLKRIILQAQRRGS